MKKVLAIFIVIVMLSLSLTSCSISPIKKYERKLDYDYNIDEYSDKEDIKDLEDIFDIEADDYDIDVIYTVKDEDTGENVFIVPCGSNKLAKDLLEDLDDKVKSLKKASSYDIDAVVDGKCALIGSEDVIKELLGK